MRCDPVPSYLRATLLAPLRFVLSVVLRSIWQRLAFALLASLFFKEHSEKEKLLKIETR